LSNTENVFTFGKYKGQTILGVIQNDPKYIQWCLDKVEFFKLNSEETELFLICHNNVETDYEEPYTFQGETGFLYPF
jgi:hypothetical protein